MENHLCSLEELQAIIKENPSAEHNTFTVLTGIMREEVRIGYCRTCVDLREELLNPMGIAHGGAEYTLMDVAAGTAAMYAKEKPRRMVTRSSDVHFIRPAADGRLTAEAKVIKAGKQTALVSVEVKDKEGKLCVYGTYELFYTT